MTSWRPTRKWIAQTVTGAIALVVMLLTGDSALSDPEIVAVGGWASAAVAGYLLPNDSTESGDGVPH
jgi:hypothetical protein